MAESSPATSIIEGTVKFRDGKKWKSRWCVMRKLSPVADCVHLQLYKDLKERQRGGQTKASLSLQQYLGLECGFTLDKESNTLALLCEDLVPVLAFDTREMLIQWRVKVQHNLGSSKEFPAVMISAPASCSVRAGPVRLHACGPRLALCAARPPHVLALWHVKLLRRYGMVEKRFCVEGGSRCGAGEGLFVFAAEGGRELSALLDVHSHHAHSRLSVASRSGSVMEKRFSDSSSMEESFQPSLRSVSPCWGVPGSRTAHCLLDCDDTAPRRPSSLPRCASCIPNITHFTRSSTMSPGSLLSPAWTMDGAVEAEVEVEGGAAHSRRPDSDRASVYSRSSGSASEYSVPRGCPPAACTPAVPVKQACHCWHQKPCSCRKKSFNGPYDNYDVPKTPMPLIQEHPAAATLYDTPKKLKCLLEGPCGCAGRPAPPPPPPSHHNYVNLHTEPELCANYANIDLTATLEKFETSLQILRSAGFSQEELEALEDIPEHEDDVSAATCDTVHPSAECCHFHTEISNKNGDNVSRVSHLSEPARPSEADRWAEGARRSNSADFTRGRPDDACFTPTALRKAPRSTRIDERPLLILEDKDFKMPEPKNETLVTKFRDAVKIRRSSSVPTKSEKNRDSSSSNDSGVSTGSLKHHRGDFDFEMPITNAKSMKKHARSKLARRAAHAFTESTSSDPLRNLTFHFDEVATMTKSNSCDAETLTRRKKRNGDAHGETSARHSQLTTKSCSSGASDTSDYMESLSVSSLSSCDVSHDRHLARPRSGNEYASIDRAALVCDRP